MSKDLVEFEANTEKAFLVFVNEDESEDVYVEEELSGLCEAAGLIVVGSMRQRLDRPYKAAYIGSGKLDELRNAVLDSGADVVVFDAELSGIQFRNLEEHVQRRFIDRTQLILDIFASRAVSREGQLQVELAQLSYMMPRLMSVYTKFERQKGGIGMRGPGETKLESDRRVAKDRISRLSDEIEDVRRQRHLHRDARRKHPFPFAVLVGYTSAGKSTLMNRLAGTDVLVDAMPFATLDPTTRKIDLPEGYALFLTDTVGFIRKLPTHLVAAFRSTLEEVTEADFIIHVVDISIPDWDMQRDAVIETLEKLGAGDKPILTVFNKVDECHQDVEGITREWPNSVAISALNGEGVGEMLARIVDMVRSYLGLVRALLPYSKNSLVDECYRFGRVHEVRYEEAGIYVEAELVDAMRRKLDPYLISP